MHSYLEKLKAAQEHAFAYRPKVGGFPYLAECLRRAGVQKNEWILPSTQCFYFMGDEVLAAPGKYLIENTEEVPMFDKEKFIAVLRQSQAGEIDFPEFLKGSWATGIVRYVVDFIERKVTYYSAHGDSYEESYPFVDVNFNP